MKIRHLFLLILLVYGQNKAITQKENIIRCNTVEHNHNLRAQYPSLSNTTEFEKWMAQRIQKIQKQRKKAKSDSSKKKYGIETYTIPIIFHIIHNGEAIGATPNIASQYIDAQIEQLNLDYANLSGSSYSVAVDTEIQFCAAKIDPTGNCLAEPGINRIDRNNLGINQPPYTDTYFNTSIKPVSQWNPDDYLNVWTGDLVSGNNNPLLGSAQWPEASYLQGVYDNNGSAITDGCVIRYSAIGSLATPFPAGTAFNSGRTLTHEMGHFLGLMHVWGDGPCSKDDFCADTPQQGSEVQGCPIGNDSCPTSPGLDMVENYMNYSNDDCMNTFTSDQSDRMLVVMDPVFGSVRRASLNDSPACGCAPIAAFSPATDLSVCTTTNTIQFINESLRTNASSTYSWVFSGAGVAPGTSNLENPIVSVSSNGSLTASLTVTTANGTDTMGPISMAVNTVAAAPISPTLFSPGNAATQITLSPTLSWAPVADADNYLVEIATDAAMTTIIQSNLTATNNATFYGLNPLTIHYWRVTAINDCNAANISSGNSSAVWSFETLDVNCLSFSATDTPMSISTSGAPTISSTITIPSGVGSIASLSVSKLSIEHSYIEDLTISLTSPGGITVLLVKEICGSTDDMNLIFDDAGNPNSSIPCPPTDGNPYQAQAPFSILNGSDPEGDWVLTISDAFSFDGGQLVCWDIEICTEDVLVCPGTLSVSTSANNVSCTGQSTGAVSAIPSGGNPTYSYVWQNSAGQSVGTTASVIDLPADSYTVFLTDGFGCVVQENAIVTEPAQQLSLSLQSQIDVFCNSMAEGQLDIQIAGGTTPYTINWSNGATLQNIQNLIAGTYSLTVTDDNNCSISDSWTITEPPALTGTMTANDISCFGIVDGSATVVPSGGVSPYDFLWNTGATGPAMSNLASGVYTVTITDDNNCETVSSAIIIEPSVLAISIDQVQNPNCPSSADGLISVSTTGGTGTINFAWSNGQSNPTATNLSQGTYTVTATDDNNCQTTETIQLTEPIIDITVNVSAPSCPGNNDGIATVSITGGLAPYTYLWSTGDTQANISNTAGTFSVSIEDDNACQFTRIVTIPPASLSVLATAYDLTCQNNSNGALWAQASGGVTPYTYDWQDNQGNSVTPSGLPVGTYTIVVTDGSGCSIMSSATINPAVNEYTNANNNKLVGVQAVTIDYEVDGQIESNQIIDSNGNDVDYDSGVSVELEVGFEVKAGSHFHAFIDGCGGTM